MGKSAPAEILSETSSLTKVIVGRVRFAYRICVTGGLFGAIIEDGNIVRRHGASQIGAPGLVH
jgi:hypothetical protein